MTRIVIFSYLLLCTLNLSAADTKAVSFPEVEGWELKVSDLVYTPGNLWDLINGAAEGYLAYDFVDLHLADYTNGTGVTVHAELYRHSTMNNAYGIYSSERSPEYNFIELGAQGYLDEGVLNYCTGPFYVKMYSTDEGEQVKEALQKVGKAVFKELDEGNQLPGLIAIFPEEGRLPYTEHYIAENFIGFDFLHSAFTAEYDEGYKLFMIKGKDPEGIRAMLDPYLAFTKQDIDLSKNHSFTIKDPYNGNIPVILKDNYLVGILDGQESPASKEKLEKLAASLPGDSCK